MFLKMVQRLAIVIFMLWEIMEKLQGIDEVLLVGTAEEPEYLES